MSQNYKDTLLLPKTDFPMKADLVKREPERLAKWEAAGLYRQIQTARHAAPLFVLHDGPPFANGDVHMGTALNKILKDLIVKSRSMLGFRAPFVPGWDCHGLPIEFKVVKEQRGLAPAEIRRRAEEFARKYIDIQRRQFKRLGVLGSWEEPYLTMAPAYEADIIRAFATFVEKGLVYQSKKPVYWSTGAQTALAEAEVEYARRTDPAIYVKFPIKGGTGVLAGASMVIWTTTPWTLPANVAVAVDPRAEYVIGEFVAQDSPAGEEHRFEGGVTLVVARALLENFGKEAGLDLTKELGVVRGEQLAGLEARHPFFDRPSRVIAADFVTMETGTGQVHIAPGHGKDDYIAGQQHGLPVLSPVDDYGKFTEEVGIPEWVGQYVFDANLEIVDFLREKGALLGEQKYSHDYPHCWRSKTPIVFRAVEQFFIRVDDIRAGALQAIEETRWIPNWGRNRIAGTVEARPDWCISRQRTWGVPLAVFYEENGAPIVRADLARKVADLVEQHGTNLWFEKDDVWWAAELGLPAGTTRRNDTLDVWIDSGVSHQAVTKRHPDLAGTNGVADVYLEATDQHRGWFQSSLMTSVALTGHAPYKTVITHGFVVDKDTRRKISKSEQGAYKKPMEADYFVNKYGADIVRLWAASVQFTDDVPFSEESFARIGEAYRSFRNVLRILLANCSGTTGGSPVLPEAEYRRAGGSTGATTIDRWMLSRLQSVIATCRTAYEEYDFRRVFETVNQFCAVDLSALYVDITKDRMYCDAANSPRRLATQAVMAQVFDAVTRLLAPILVYTADEAWEFAGHSQSVHVETFPEVNAALRNPELEEEIETWLKLRAVTAQSVESARQQKLVGNALEAAVTLEIAAPTELTALQARKDELEEFIILSDLTLVAGPENKAHLVRTSHAKCARCWRHRPTVGKNAAQPELCDRCAGVCSGAL
jgi:isoleucyl-tRNA synthetase